MILKANGEIIASDVEFAKSIISQAKGLMFRRSIHVDYAMLFVMKKPKKVSLHMLFVPFPIDVLFLDEKRNIMQTTRLSPWIGTTACKEDTKYIIEIPEGTIAKHDLCVGDHIQFAEK